MTASARTMEFKVLELDQNQPGPYALFSGGKIDGLAVGDEVCVQKEHPKGTAFCTKIVSLRKRAAAFYIPAGNETDVAMGSIVTFKSAKEADVVAASETSENLEPVQSPSKPWFFPAQHFDVGYHLQITSAIETNAVSFQALPRDTLNKPWTARQALNLAPLGLGFGYARDFLREGNHLGIRGFYSQSQKGSFDNDYDLSDINSHVESDTLATTLGLAVFYGIDRNLAENIGYRASGGAGTALTSGVAELVIGELFETRADVIEGSHVAWLLLAPDPLLLSAWIFGDNFFEHLVVQWVELFDADDGGVFDFVLFAEFEEVVIHLTTAKDETCDALWRGEQMLIVQDFTEARAFRHVGDF